MYSYQHTNYYSRFIFTTTRADGRCKRQDLVFLIIRYINVVCRRYVRVLYYDRVLCCIIIFRFKYFINSERAHGGLRVKYLPEAFVYRT